MFNNPYMSSGSDAQTKKTLTWIIGLNLVVFVLQNILNKDSFSHLFAFTHDSLTNGFIWAPITYAFLHSTSGPFHVLMNMLGVFFLGRMLLPVIGQKRFVQLYLGSAVVGGLLWYAVSFISGSGAVIGASGAVLGLLTMFACLSPDKEIQILLFFVIPVRVKPKYIVWISLFIGGVGMLFSEMARDGSATAHSAHLGGMLGGYLFYKFIYLKNPHDTGDLNISIPKIFRKPTSKTSAAGYRYNVNVPTRKDLKNEVDRILDKINSSGFGALSTEEKRILDEAKDILRKR